MIGSRKKLQKRVNVLANEMAKLEVGRKRRPRARRGNTSRGVPAGASSLPTPVAAGPGFRRRRGRMGMGTSIGNGGRIVLQRDELLLQVVTTANKNESVFSKPLTPSSGLMPFLFQISSCYQRIRWLKCHVTWRPGVGTSTNGIITYGFQFNDGAAPSSRADVTNLTPVNDHAVWQSGSSTPLVVPSDMLMSRKWYVLNSTSADAYDKALGSFCCGVSHDSKATTSTLGEFWVSYSVEMEGTRTQ